MVGRSLTVQLRNGYVGDLLEAFLQSETSLGVEIMFFCFMPQPYSVDKVRQGEYGYQVWPTKRQTKANQYCCPHSSVIR